MFFTEKRVDSETGWFGIEITVFYCIAGNVSSKINKVIKHIARELNFIFLSRQSDPIQLRKAVCWKQRLHICSRTWMLNCGAEKLEHARREQILSEETQTDETMILTTSKYPWILTIPLNEEASFELNLGFKGQTILRRTQRLKVKEWASSVQLLLWGIMSSNTSLAFFPCLKGRSSCLVAFGFNNIAATWSFAWNLITCSSSHLRKLLALCEVNKPSTVVLCYRWPLLCFPLHFLPLTAWFFSASRPSRFDGCHQRWLPAWICADVLQ